LKKIRPTSFLRMGASERGETLIRRISLSALILTALLALACQPAAEQSEPEAATEDLKARAEKLAQEILIVDTHVDVPYRMEEEMEDISLRTEKGDFDYPRAMTGGLNAPFMSIYVPASYQKTGGAKEFADGLIDMVEKFESDWPEKFAVARSSKDVMEQFQAKKIALPMGMENGAPVEDDLSNLEHFKKRGIGYITLTHSENNQICDSSYTTEREWEGLSPFGKKVVAEMNRQGIMIDISHVSDKAFYQVMEISRAPAIASHSSARKFTPGWERNIDDDMIKLLAKNGGVVGIAFGSAFISGSANTQTLAYYKARGEFKKANDLADDSAELEEFQENFWKDKTKIFADVSDVAAHIDHVAKLVGVDHVGFGSDFDGVGDSLPTGLKDVSYYPRLIQELLKLGYSDEDIEKIAGGNFMRVWKEVEKIAAEMSGASDSAF
jgi:membrane dipeptidase